MSRRKFEDLKYRLCEELEELTEKGQWREKDIEMIDHLTHSIKSVMRYLEMDDPEYDYEYEGRSYASRGRGGRYRDGYDPRYHDHSYSSRYYDDGSSYDEDNYRGRSRDDGKEKMVEELEGLMTQVTDSETKEAIKKTMAYMKKTK